MLESKKELRSLKSNSAQQAAITHESGPVLCLAGPGSGKTFTLTHHIRYLILEKHIEPSQILVITFSKAAALQMQSRFNELMGDIYYPVRFGTFHAVFFQILSRYEGYSTKDILTISQKKQYLKSVFARMDYHGKEDADTMEMILQYVSAVKNSGGLHKCMERQENMNEGKGAESDLLTKIEAEIPQFTEMYRCYETFLRGEHQVDFDDMMLLCYELFIEKPSVLAECRKEMQYILVDEYQDINSIQYEILKLLLKPYNNLFAVGDDDQSIYGFRGSDPEIMLRFQKDFPNGRIIPFEKNYRSTSEIVSFASRIIQENRSRYEKKMDAVKEGEGVFLHSHTSKEEEYEKLLRKLHDIKEEGGLEKCACLFRTNMDASYLAEILLKEKIPYIMKEKSYNPYEHFICQDFLHYLRVRDGDRGLKEFVPIMNRPLRYLSRDAIGGSYVDFEGMMEFYRDKEYMRRNIQKLQYDLRRMKGMDLYAAVNYIRKGIGYDEYLRKLASEQGITQNNYIKIADELQKRFAMFRNVEELEQHIMQYRDISQRQMKQNDTKGVTLMTYHASKGLEFDRVFLPDCNEGVIPHKKSILPSQVEEERRLFYVAMTRAKEELHIMFVEGTKEEKHLISRFLKQVYRGKH